MEELEILQLKSFFQITQNKDKRHQIHGILTFSFQHLP